MPPSQGSPSVRGGSRAGVKVPRIPRRAWVHMVCPCGCGSLQLMALIPEMPRGRCHPAHLPQTLFPAAPPSSYNFPPWPRGAAGWWAHQATSSPPRGRGGVGGAGRTVQSPAGSEPRLCASHEPVSPRVGQGATAPFPADSGLCCEGLNSGELTYLGWGDNGGVACQGGPDGNKGQGGCAQLGPVRHRGHGGLWEQEAAASRHRGRWPLRLCHAVPGARAWRNPGGPRGAYLP